MEEATIHRDSTGMSLDFDLKRFDEPTRIGEGWVYPSRYEHGWWAPTTEAFGPELHLFPDAPLTEAEMREVRELFADHMQSLDMHEFAQWVREGRTRVVRPLPWGYIRNGITALSGVIILLAMGSSLRNASLSVTAKRRRAKGLCPHCGYDLQGASAGRCPECGWKESNA